jgi:hypothetical protein
MPSLLPIFRWFDTTWLNSLINDSNWLFPAIEAVHIVALAMLLGGILILNLRLLGVVLSGRPTQRVKRELAPWIHTSLVIILVTGVMLFSSEAVRSYFSGPFRIKMLLLAGAILFHFTVQRGLIRADDRISPLWGKASAAISLVLWFGVGFAGRAIGFF